MKRPLEELLKELINPQEIVSLITHAAINNSNAFIWKRNDAGKIAFNENVKVIKVIDNQELRVEYNESFEGKQGDVVFFALEAGTLIFKSKIIRLVNKIVIMELPTMAKGVERRRSQRVDYNIKDRINLELEFVSHRDHQRKRISAYLINLSEHGMCLGFTNETVKHLELGTKLKITLTTKNIYYSECLVKSIRPHKRETIQLSSLYAVGFEFVQVPIGENV
jgi:hypothetical protein